MPHYRGKNVVVKFANTVVSGDGRSISYEENADTLDDTTYGLDNKTKIASLLDGSGSFEALDVTGNWASAWTALEAGATGTMVIQPEGTGASLREVSFTAIIKSRALSAPYDDLSTVRVAFEISGPVTEGVQAGA